MKSKKSRLRAALFLALIGAAFVFTACWQGTPAGGSGVPGSPGTVNPGGNNSGGGNTTASSIEGITWEDDTTGNITLLLKGGNAQLTSTAVGQTLSDSGKYTINGDIIKFTRFQGVGIYLNRKFKYKIEGNILTLSDDVMDTLLFKFKKA